jgi:hypothetical protein
LSESPVAVGKYGVIELQTTDTHGSYSHAVKALTSALDLHKERFSDQLAENPEWAGRKIEGPNISNVFKRTFYQIAFKFQVTKRETSVGCALAFRSQYGTPGSLSSARQNSTSGQTAHGDF